MGQKQQLKENFGTKNVKKLIRVFKAESQEVL